MLLALKVMLLEIEVMLLSAEGLPLHAEVMLLQVEVLMTIYVLFLLHRHIFRLFVVSCCFSCR